MYIIIIGNELLYYNIIIFLGYVRGESLEKMSEIITITCQTTPQITSYRSREIPVLPKQLNKLRGTNQNEPIQRTSLQNVVKIQNNKFLHIQTYLQ